MRVDARGRRRFAATLLLAAVVSGCGRSSQPPETALVDVMDGQIADGSEITIEGTVVSLTPLPAATMVSYRLSDGSASVVVVADEGSAPPQLADRIRLRGIVRTDYRVDVPGQDPIEFGTVIEESSRAGVGASEASAAELWTWAGGVAGIVILGWLVAWAVIRRANGSEVENLMPCRGCKGEVREAWVSCPWCGIKLDAKPPSSATMLVEPIGGEMPIAEIPSPSARATILIEPDGDGR